MARFVPNQNTWVGFLPSTAPGLTGTLTSPKMADVTAAVDLTHQVTAINASSTGSAVPTPAFDTRFEESIAGTVQGTFTADFYRDDTADIAWTTLTRGKTGYFIIARFGGMPIVGAKVEVWPVTVLSRSVPNETNNAPVTCSITCSIPQTPGEDAVVVT